MNWQEALDNCRNKFVSGSGRLFEPRNSSINQAVWEAADDKLGDSSDGEFWLGMNDLKDGLDQLNYRFGISNVYGQISTRLPISQ